MVYLRRYNRNTRQSIGIENPFRYRGYWYDTETGLYNLQSRYDNLELRRFISADGLFESGHEVLGNDLVKYTKIKYFFLSKHINYLICDR